MRLESLTGQYVSLSRLTPEDQVLRWFSRCRLRCCVLEYVGWAEGYRRQWFVRDL